MSVLTYSSWFISFGFAGVGSVWPAVVLDFFPDWDGGVGRGTVLWSHDAHLLLLHFNAGSFLASLWVEMEMLFSLQRGVRRLSMGYGSRISQGLILIDALFSTCWEKKERRKKKKE
jgi:hypothetical protein